MDQEKEVKDSPFLFLGRPLTGKRHVLLKKKRHCVNSVRGLWCSTSIINHNAIIFSPISFNSIFHPKCCITATFCVCSLLVSASCKNRLMHGVNKAHITPHTMSLFYFGWLWIIFIKIYMDGSNSPRSANRSDNVHRMSWVWVQSCKWTHFAAVGLKK